MPGKLTLSCVQNFKKHFGYGFCFVSPVNGKAVMYVGHMMAVCFTSIFDVQLYCQFAWCVVC